MTDPVTSPVAATITLRVAEAPVEDIAHAIARLAPVDLERIGARPGDILKITGRTVAVARAIALLVAVIARALALRPKIIVAGWSAYSRQLDFPRFREIADEVGAYLFVDMAHFAGLVAADLHPSPVPYADVVTTTIHKTIGGGRGGMILCKEEYAKKIDSAVFPGQQGGPLEHLIAGKAVALRIAQSEAFRERQQRTLDGARALATELLSAGHGVSVLTGGTDVHHPAVDRR